jgi:hypothetical protein
MTYPSRTFCVLPWLHAATLTDGSVQLCCVSGGGSGVNLNEQTLGDYWNSEYVKAARRQMLAGQELAACQHCYHEERHGYQSHRMVENENWQERYGKEGIRDLINKTTPDGTLDSDLQYLDLRLGNTCNMQCIMCQPHESSRWVLPARELAASSQNKELKREWKFRSLINPKRFEWYRNDSFWSDLKSFLPRIKEVTIGGGEPFLIKEQFAFVKACCEMGEANHIRLRYHTNGTVFPGEMVPYWEQFEWVHFLVSLDGIGDVANYVRYPSNWKDIENNIRHFDALSENTITNFNFTTHALNIHRIPEVFDWAEASGLRNRKRFADMQQYVSASLVHHPTYQTVRVLPIGCKRIITEKIGAYTENRLTGQRVDKLTAILNFMNAEDHSHRLPSLVEYTKMLDITRGTKFAETFPELVPYWMDRGQTPSSAIVGSR